MGGAVPPLPQCAFMVWCSVGGAQGQLYLYLYLYFSNPTQVCMAWCLIKHSLSPHGVELSLAKGQL